jgi:hypothetical protein
VQEVCPTILGEQRQEYLGYSNSNVPHHREEQERIQRARGARLRRGLRATSCTVSYSTGGRFWMYVCLCLSCQRVAPMIPIPTYIYNPSLH